MVPSTLRNTITALTPEKVPHINGTADSFAVDAYSTSFATSRPGWYQAWKHNMTGLVRPSCIAAGDIQANGWLAGEQSNAYPKIAPQFVRQQVGYIWNTYRPSGTVDDEGEGRLVQDGHDHELRPAVRAEQETLKKLQNSSLIIVRIPMCRTRHTLLVLLPG